MVNSGLINTAGPTSISTTPGRARAAATTQRAAAERKFPDMKALCDEVHALGLKIGHLLHAVDHFLRQFCRRLSDDPKARGARNAIARKAKRFGANSFAAADAKQWAAWGIDYLKYDWNPIDVPHVEEMSKAFALLAATSFSASRTPLPSNTPPTGRGWRTAGEPPATFATSWLNSRPRWQYGVSEIAFSQDRWAPFAGPGHWNDPDMLVVGQVGWGPSLHPTHLTPDRTILAHQHVVPAFGAAADRLRPGAARRLHAQSADQRRSARAAVRRSRANKPCVSPLSVPSMFT